MQDLIELKNVDKAYIQNKKKIYAIQDCSFTIPKGKFVSIMGPSGCGKSTLSKLIIGIEDIDNGQLFINNTDCSKMVPKSIKENIGYIFQGHNLLEWRTVEKNLYFPLEMYNKKKDDSWNQIAEKYLDMVGLKEYKHVYPHELSGGMRQRVGIARSLILDPEILILDQPFGALDAITRKMIAKSFYDLYIKTQKTIVMVTSNIEEALFFSDIIIVLTPTPGRVQSILNIDIPHSKRNSSLLVDGQFLNYKLMLIKIIKQQCEKKKDLEIFLNEGELC